MNQNTSIALLRSEIESQKDEIIPDFDKILDLLTDVEDWETELKDEVTSKNSRIDDLETEIKNHEETIDENEIEVIQHPLGKIKYLQPDNLKLRGIMDDLKRKIQGHNLD